jgi:chromosome segregation ATPase
MSRPNVGVLLCIGLLGLLGVGNARAQEARSGGGASAQLVQQLQQLGSERTELQAQNTKLQKDLEDMRKERDGLKAAQQGLERRMQASEAAVHQAQTSVSDQRETNDKEIAKWKNELEQVVQKFRETTQTLQEVETDRNDLKQQLAVNERKVNACIDNNLALYKINVELLDHLDHQSLWSSMARAEPFTQIKRTQLDNLVVEYQQRAAAQRLQDKTSN